MVPPLPSEAPAPHLLCAPQHPGGIGSASSSQQVVHRTQPAAQSAAKSAAHVLLLLLLLQRRRLQASRKIAAGQLLLPQFGKRL